jgi:hypothetical protein
VDCEENVMAYLNTREDVEQISLIVPQVRAVYPKAYANNDIIGGNLNPRLLWWIESERVKISGEYTQQRMAWEDALNRIGGSEIGSAPPDTRPMEEKS